VIIDLEMSIIGLINTGLATSSPNRDDLKTKGGAVAKALAKGSRITGAQRTELASRYAKRYAAGESIRKIADDAGRSFGFVHGVLKEAGVELRGRGGATRGVKKAASSTAAKKSAGPAKKTAAKKSPAKAAKAPAKKTTAKKAPAKKTATKAAAKKTAAKKAPAKKTTAKAAKAPAKKTAAKKAPAKKATAKKAPAKKR
jgi:Helix-turn-helix domain